MEKEAMPDEKKEPKEQLEDRINGFLKMRYNLFYDNRDWHRTLYMKDEELAAEFALKYGDTEAALALYEKIAKRWNPYNGGHNKWCKNVVALKAKKGDIDGAIDAVIKYEVNTYSIMEYLHHGDSKIRLEKVACMLAEKACIEEGIILMKTLSFAACVPIYQKAIERAASAKEKSKLYEELGDLYSEMSPQGRRRSGFSPFPPEEELCELNVDLAKMHYERAAQLASEEKRKQELGKKIARFEKSST